MSRILLTGSPCSGKTSVLKALEESLPPDYATFIPEAAREYVSFLKQYEHYKLDDRMYLQNLIETMQIKAWVENPNGIFDRGIPDQMAYRSIFNMKVPEVLFNSAKKYRYDKVFYMPFYPEIYQQDEIRRETLKEAQSIDTWLTWAYSVTGYEVMEVPKIPVDERIEFILSHI